MKQIDFRALFTIYQDRDKAIKGLNSWTYGASRRYYAKAIDAANAMLNERDTVVKYIEGNYQRAKRCEDCGVFIGSHGEVLSSIVEVGSLLDVLREED